MLCEKRECDGGFWRKNENKFKMVFQYVKLRFTPYINSYVANALRKESFKSIRPN